MRRCFGVLFYGLDKCVDVLEGEVDACKADPRDTVDGLKCGHDAFADIFGRDLGDERFGEVAFDPGDDRALLFACDRALLARAFESAENFIAVPGFFAAVGFKDGGQLELGVFVGCKSPFACFACAPSSDGVSVSDEPAVDDSGIVMTTSRAAHRRWWADLGFEFGDASGVASVVTAIERSACEGAQACFHDFGAENACTEHDDIGIVVLARHACGVGFVHERGTRARHFVGGDAHANTGAADQYAPCVAVIDHGVGEAMRKIRVIHRLRILRSEIFDL